MNSLRIEEIASHPSFRRLNEIPGVVIDLRYAGSNNFAGRVLYKHIDCAWLRVEAAQGLTRSAAWLARHHRELRLVVLDALRPQRVQEAIWHEVAGTPSALYFAEPTRGSIHSFGMAVDVTLIDARGDELDMGSAFDEMSPRSHPALEDEQLGAGAITLEHIAARRVLRRALHEGGFEGIPTEWWHFNHGDPHQVRATLSRVL